jgi:8-oxo-dGTP pyrophosphatase MutT (NUDIX family)
MSQTDHFLNRFLLQNNPLTSVDTHQGARDAAVLIPLISRPDGWYVLFTQRNWQLRHHPGQICFPGGKKDDSDISLQMTALREMEEELGIAESQIKILGQLSSGHTVTGYLIHPYLALIRSPFHLKPAKDEVAAVFELPLGKLLDINAYKPFITLRHGKQHKVIGLTIDGWFIWGATAKILYQLAKEFG